MADEVLSQEEIEKLIQQSGSGADGQTAGASGSVVEVVPGTGALDSVIRPMEFGPLAGSANGGPRSGVELIMDVELQVSVELGRAILAVRDVLALGPGSVVELDKHAGEPVEVVVNNKTVARGEVVVIDENFGVRITEIVSSNERDVRVKAA